MKDAIEGNAVELLSCSEIREMPPDGTVAFIEFLHRDPAIRHYHGAIRGAGITVPDGYRGTQNYGYKGAFLKGKNYVPVTDGDETDSEE